VHEDWTELDQRPGKPLETFWLNGGVQVVLMHVGVETATALTSELVLRCEPDGRILAGVYESRAVNG
jgi:hypothetical protein